MYNLRFRLQVAVVTSVTNYWQHIGTGFASKHHAAWGCIRYG